MKAIVILAVIGAALWYMLKGKTTAISRVATTTMGAQAIIDNPTKAVAQHVAYTDMHPSAINVVDQADSHLLAGRADISDIIRFETELSVYDQYVRAGGSKAYEDFMINDYRQMPAIYKAQIDEAKAVSVSIQADEVLEGFQTTDAYGNITGIRTDAIQQYVEGRSTTSPLIQVIKERFPELFKATVPEPVAVASAELVSPEAPEVKEPTPYTPSYADYGLEPVMPQPSDIEIARAMEQVVQQIAAPSPTAPSEPSGGGGSTVSSGGTTSGSISGGGTSSGGRTIAIGGDHGMVGW